MRRIVLAPLALVLSAALVVASPLLIGLAAAVDLAASRRRLATVRIVSFVVVYAAFEVAGLIALLGLWLAAGAGRRLASPAMKAAHYGLMRWLLGGLNRAARRLFRFKIRIDDRPDARPGRILVFSRHAGTGNSLMLVGTVMVGYQRDARVVLLAALQWEPLFDILLNRLPNRFIAHQSGNPQQQMDAIRSLAHGMGDRDALVLFPEGHDFTPKLRLRVIDHFRRKGRPVDAARAEKLHRVLPPKHGGVTAAIAGAPEADVVFVAHTVLEDIGSLADLWRRVPFGRPVLARVWRIPAHDVPHDRARLIPWLFEWWLRIDRWVADHSSG